MAACDFMTLFRPGKSEAVRAKSISPVASHSFTEDKLSAFEAMVSRDWDRFWRYSYRLCGNPEDAEDLLSESLVEAFQSFARYRGVGFDMWLFRILTTNRIDMTRRAKIRRADSLDTAYAGDDGTGESRCIPDEEADPARILLNPILSEDIQVALDLLPPEFRAALLLCDVEQMEYQEIAQMLQLPIGTVRSRIHRARAQMRSALEKSGRTR
jgi:RNA polymerase sigma-70 factor (ECF subfamily)